MVTLKASEKAKFASLEAKYFLLQLCYNYEQQYDKAYELSTSLYKEFPNNVVFHRYVGRSSFVLSKFGESAAVFSDISDRCDKNDRGYNNYAKREAIYYLGMISMNVSNYDQALKYFYQCDELSRVVDKEEGSPFMTMTNLRIGMIYDIQKKRNYAIMQYQKVQRMTKFEIRMNLHNNI